MAILEKFTKQPAEVKHYDVHFTDFLAALGDSVQSTPVVVADVGVTQPYPASILDGVVKVWIAGGTSGVSYKVTITLTTVAGWVEQQEFMVKVKEI